jgi:hypothetical protein
MAFIVDPKKYEEMKKLLEEHPNFYRKCFFCECISSFFNIKKYDFLGMKDVPICMNCMDKFDEIRKEMGDELT